MKTAVIPRSNTASNVGNDFFYNGVSYALEKIGLRVCGTYFNPYNAYHLSKSQAQNNLDYQAWDSDADYVVISGPVLDLDFGFHFEPMLKMARSSGKKILMLSVGGRKYDKQEVEHCSRILNTYQPDVFISRDEDTYRNYHRFASHSYNGICFAFFAPDYFSGYQTNEKYYAVCFDFAPEPDLKQIIDNVSRGNLQNLGKSHGTKSKLNKIRHVLQRRFPDSINGTKVVRLNHRPIRNPKLVFNRKNVVSSFTSEVYLNIYKNTRMTITDRLHAAVVTLAFGNEAMLCLSSNRTKLLDRAGIGGCVNTVYKANLEVLNKEKENQLDFLARVI